MFYHNNPDLYPTPDWLIDKMLDKVELKSFRNILEPSCGYGNIVKKIKSKLRPRDLDYLNIDVIEIDKDLQIILKDKGVRVIHDDFLTFESEKSYGLIIANPPFSADCKHLLKMIEIQEKNGGEIVCLLNAETIKNPYSNDRKYLASLLSKYNADIEYIKNAFADKDSLRKTNVEIALIYIKIDKQYEDSIILEHLKQEEEYKTHQSGNSYVVPKDFIEQIISRYNFEANAGIKLINEYEQLLPLLSKDFDDESPILELVMFDERHSRDYDNLNNKFIRRLRYKYWKTLFRSEEMTKLFTNDLRAQYNDKLAELQNYDFSKYNIEQIQLDIKIMLKDSLEKTILQLFETLIDYAFWDGYKKNIHYYNGWKTNEAHKISDKRNILPWNAYCSWSNDFSPSHYTFVDKIRDLHKTFTYLDNGGTIAENDIMDILKQAEMNNQTKDIKLEYFSLDCYKKGTTHFTWKRPDLIKKLNIMGSRKKGWLPPDYGKDYDDMTQEEKSVIDSFQGEEDYVKTIQNKNFYLGEIKLLGLGGSS